MKIAVFGAGMVGRAIALDLGTGYEVTAFDFSNNNLELLKKKNSSIKTIQADLSKYHNYSDWLGAFDLIVSAVPGAIGYKTLEAIINAGKNAVDISFFPENSLDLDELAKKKNITVVTDCGVAPGLSNLILGRQNEELEIESFACYVGGLPVERKKPFEYKAPFSPADVIEEYIRPARLMEKGKIVTKPAMSDLEILNFEETGQLEAFNTDGLRSLLFTMNHIPEMKEKTMRYPGHTKLISLLKDTGLFDKTPITINNTKISPLEFISKLLIEEWKLEPEEKEFTIMKISIIGKKDNKPKRTEFILLDYYDEPSGISSMARTTGYTCTASVNLLAEKLFTEKGVFPPELVGKNKKCFDFIINYLKERKVLVKENKN